MIPYASATGAGRNRDSLQAAGWGVLISPRDPRPTDGFNHICLDNGEWPAFQEWIKAARCEAIVRGLTKEAAEAEAMAAWVSGGWRTQKWDEEAFERALERYGADVDFVVLPDIVAGGMESLALSLRWSNRCMAACNLVLIAVQDGMEPADLEPYVGPRVGIFLGGSTEWKLANAEKWGRWCASRPCIHPLSTPEEPRTGIWYHIARVNTGIRFRLAHAADADSVDGSSVTKFGNTLPLLENHRRQPDLFSARRSL